MPFTMVHSNALAHGRPSSGRLARGGISTSGATVSPAANELVGLSQHLNDDLHLRGTPMQQGASAQVETLRRPVMDDPEAAGAVGAPDKLGAMATRATLAMDRPEQALQRMGMDGNNSGPQLQTEMQSAAGLVREVVGPQQVQRALDQQRRVGQEMTQASYVERTGTMADAQAFLTEEKLKLMGPRELATLDGLYERMMRPGSTFAIGA